MIDGSNPTTSHDAIQLIRKTLAAIGRLPLAEWAAIALLWGLFICLFAPNTTQIQPDGLDLQPLNQILFNPEMRQSGLEHERLSGVILAAQIGLQNYGHIPTWNPYIGTGEPLINDAFSYLFNPFHSLPILFLGGAQGSKVSMFLALLIAGYGMWTLAKAVGLGGLARVTTAALYMMCGGIAGKFAAGHFQLAMSLAWPPFVIAALWWTLHSPRRIAPVAFGIAFALLFLAGNIYYVLHTLICCALIVLVHVFERRDGRWRLRVDRLRQVAIAGAFGFGLAGIQFFPVWQTRPYVDHNNQVINDDGTLQGSYSLAQATANFIYPWPDWRTFEVLYRSQLIAVDNAYVGVGVFLVIAAGAGILVVGSQSKSRYAKLVVIALILALVMMLWGAGQTPILEWLYKKINLLAEFRYIGRALAIAALWWIVLAGVAIDLMWRAAHEWFKTAPGFNAYDGTRLVRAIGLGAGVWLYFLLYSVVDPATRLAMAFNDFGLLNQWDAYRFVSFRAAADGLWLFIIIAVLVDTLVLAVVCGFTPLWNEVTARKYGIHWRALGTRALRVCAMVATIGMIADVMKSDSLMYEFVPFKPYYGEVYTQAQRQENTTPFPSISHPFSPIAFEGYEAEIRNWNLDEGWKPQTLPGFIPISAGGLLALPHWAVVTYEAGGSATQIFAERFIQSSNYRPVGCYPRQPATAGVDPCDKNQSTTILFELQDALPYAFVAPVNQLMTDADTVTGKDVTSAQLIRHEQDSITLQATTPDDGVDYVLIVQETNFPGWEAFIDGNPVQPMTAQMDYTMANYRGFVTLRLPPGTHTYTLRFVPPGFTTGLVVTLGTVFAVGVYLTRKGKQEENTFNTEDKSERAKEQKSKKATVRGL